MPKLLIVWTLPLLLLRELLAVSSPILDLKVSCNSQRCSEVEYQLLLAPRRLSRDIMTEQRKKADPECSLMRPLVPNRVETKLTKLAGMKAIRSDNDRREKERGRRTEQRKEKKMANYGKNC
jgi:hypothetical protein